MAYQSVVDQILRRIRGSGRGYVFTPFDFLDLGSRASVDQALARLVKKEEIRRVATGLYDYPRISARLGILAPSAAQVRKAIARKTGASVKTSGAHLANLLGLSTQVPSRQVFETAGRARRVRIGTHDIEFRRTTAPMQRYKEGTAEGVIRALRYLGRNGVGEREIRQLAKILSSEDKRQLQRMRRRAPAWLHPVIQRITEGS
ncbi:MAG: DUF6088 family protein [Gemmatimonadaceae bacterium]